MQFDEIKGQNAMRRFFRTFLSDRMDNPDLPTSYGPFIIELFSENGTSHKELTERVNLNRSLTSRVLKTLIEEGYAENRSAGKEYSIFLTEKGENTKRMILDHMLEARRYLFADCTEEEIKTLRRIGAKVIERAEGYFSDRP